jgi:hypothetical protein
MPPAEELEIEIDPTGRVMVTTKGIKGPACLAYRKLLQEILGEVVEQRLTSGYYEKPPGVSIAPAAHARRRLGK